jgi:hypothetical protein
MDQLREVTVTESAPTTLVTVSATGMQGPQGNPTTVNGHTGASITLTSSDVGAVPTTAVGSVSGVASLDGSGLVPVAQIPVTSLAGDFLDLSTNQTIATGIKTFGVSPIVPTPTTSTQTANKGYADLMLPKTGGTMSGTIAMGSNKITGLTNGSSAQDVAAFGQIPTSASAIGGLLKASNLSDVTTPATAFNNISPTTTLGDTIYGGASGVGTRLAGNTVATRKFMRQLGTGSASAAPVWDTLVEADVPASMVGRTDWINVKSATYGAVGDGTNDDTAAINAALAAANAAGGGTVYLPWGNYRITGQLSIPPYTYLRGESQISLNLFSSVPSTYSRIVVDSAWAPGAASGAIAIQSKTPGGWSVNTQSCGLKNIFVDGSLNTSTNVSGILLAGPVYDVHLDDVFLWKMGHNGIIGTTQTETGINTNSAYHQRYTRVSAVNCGNYGFGIGNSTDSDYVECLSFANTAAGYNLTNNSNSNFYGCRAEWNSSYGFQITGTSGSITFTGCTTDQNSREGLYIDATAAQTSHGSGIIWLGGKMHADANAAASGHTYGINVFNSTVPVTITGVNVECGQNPNSLNYFPATALTISGSSNVTVTGSILQGISQAYLNGGTNTNINVSGCITAVGNPGSQTLSTLKGYAPIIANTTVANTVTKTQLAGFSIPGGEPEIGATYELEVYGSHSVTGTPTLLFGLYWGGVSGTSLVNSAVITAPTSGISGAAWRTHALVTFRTATTVTVEMKVGLVSNTSSGSLIEWLYTTGTTTVTVSSSSASVLALGFTWGTASASNTITAVGGELTRNI